MKLFTRCVSRALALGCLTLVAAFQIGCGSGGSSGGSKSLPPGSGLAVNVDVYLRADQYRIPGASGTTPGPFGNTSPITMWGFVRTTGADFATPAPTATRTSLSIPAITANECDTLVIHVKNNLPAGFAPTFDGGGNLVAPGLYTEPVSVFIPGQRFIPASNAPADTGPTWIDSGNVSVGPRGDNTDLRVRSFTVETAIGAQRTYSFGPLKPGTYLVQSGTHPAVQMQMGLYGVLTVRPVAAGCGAPLAGRAYAHASSAFDNEATLLFSEIDPVLHDAVATGQYGPSDIIPQGWLLSTLDYHPRYFLVNGAPFTAAGSPPVTTPTPLLTNQRLLLRMVNAGLQTKVPAQNGQYLSLIAEDGNFYSVVSTLPNRVPAGCPAPRRQYSALLPAGKTVDALLTTPATPGAIALFDRRFNLTNNGGSPGGMLAVLRTAAGAVTPPAPPAVCQLTN